MTGVVCGGIQAPRGLLEARARGQSDSTTNKVFALRGFYLQYLIPEPGISPEYSTMWHKKKNQINKKNKRRQGIKSQEPEEAKLQVDIGHRITDPTARRSHSKGTTLWGMEGGIDDTEKKNLADSEKIKRTLAYQHAHKRTEYRSAMSSRIFYFRNQRASMGLKALV